MLNIFEYRTDILAVFVSMTWFVFLSRLCQMHQYARFVPGSVLLSPMVTRVSESLRFVIFSSKFTICDVTLESTIKVLLSCSWFDVFVINIYHRLRLILRCVQIIFPHFSSCSNHFLRECSLGNSCIYSCYLCYFCSLIFIPWLHSDSLSWHVWVCCSYEILVCLHLIYAISHLLCAGISCKLCMYPCIWILCRGIFHLLLRFLVPIVNSFGHISPKACHGSPH